MHKYLRIPKMAGLCNIDEAHLLGNSTGSGLPETVYGLGANALDTMAVAKV